MDPMLKRIVEKFEREVRKLNGNRSGEPYRSLHVTVLGQQALLIRRENLRGLSLLATTDFDAYLKGEPPLEDVFKRLLREEGLSYDEKSEYIWLPEETTYETMYESSYVTIVSPLPIFLLTSKAKMAPERNKQLVADAIVEFGEPLLRLFEKHGVDIDNFV